MLPIVLKIYNPGGIIGFGRNYASAEALAQSLQSHQLIVSGTSESTIPKDDALEIWMSDSNRLETNPGPSRMPIAGRTLVARNTRDEKKLALLADDPSVYVRLCVAENTKTPHAIKANLRNQGIYGRAENSAMCANLSPLMLEELSFDMDSSVRVEVAMNSSTPTHVLERLSKDRNQDVCAGVAWNRSGRVPIDVLWRLSHDESMHVREVLAQNTKTPLVILKELAKEEGSVRASVLVNPSWKET